MIREVLATVRDIIGFVPKFTLEAWDTIQEIKGFLLEPLDD